MKKIGLLSDTHGHLDAAMWEFLSDVDEIWHAGDVGSISVIDELRKRKPVRAVYGNIDDHTLRIDLPEIQVFGLEGIQVVMIHIGGYPKRYVKGVKALIKKEQAKIFISGHSHILKVIYDKELDCLHLNPGAAGTHGFHKVRTMLRFKIDAGNIADLEIWEKER